MRSHAGHEGPLPAEVEQVPYVNGEGTVLTGEVLESQVDRLQKPLWHTDSTKSLTELNISDGLSKAQI